LIPATSGAARTRTRAAGGPARPRLQAWYASAARIPLTLGCVAVLWLLGLGTAFKTTFQPDYQPLFMAYPDPAALPAIATALTRAYLPRPGTRHAARLAHRLLRPTPSGTAQ